MLGNWGRLGDGRGDRRRTGQLQGLIVEHHGHRVINLEADMLVKMLLMGGHEINPLRPANVGVAQDRLHQLAPNAAPLKVGMHHHVPDGCSVDSIGGSTAEPHQPIAHRRAHNGVAVGEGNAEIVQAAIGCPVGREVKQIPKLGEVKVGIKTGQARGLETGIGCN